jgi:hypothetical protein
LLPVREQQATDSPRLARRRGVRVRWAETREGEAEGDSRDPTVERSDAALDTERGLIMGFRPVDE